MSSPVKPSLRDHAGQGFEFAQFAAAVQEAPRISEDTKQRFQVIASQYEAAEKAAKEERAADDDYERTHGAWQNAHAPTFLNAHKAAHTLLSDPAVANAVKDIVARPHGPENDRIRLHKLTGGLERLIANEERGATRDGGYLAVARDPITVNRGTYDMLKK